MKIRKFKDFILERRDSYDKYDLLRDLDDEFLLELFESKNGKKEDLDDEELLYYVNVWDYVDDDDFVEDFISGEMDYYVDDFESQYGDDYNKKQYLVPFIVENIDDLKEEIINVYIEKKKIKSEKKKEELKNLSDDELEELLEEKLDPKDCVKIIEDGGLVEKIVEEILRERYDGQNAFEILSEFEKSDTLYDPSFVTKNNYQIQNYINFDSIRDNVGEWENHEVVDKLDTDDEDVQSAIYEKYPEKILDLVEFEMINPNFGDTVEFQRNYFNKVKEKNDIITKNDIDMLTDNDIEILDEINDEFGLDYISTGTDLGIIPDEF